MTTLEMVNKKPKKLENVRARLHSLKNIVNMIDKKPDQDSLIQLQKSLQKHNTIDPDTRKEQFTGRDSEDIIIEDKLWNYFKSKSEQYNNKIEREKVNGWSKILKKILIQTDKKIKLNGQNIQKMQQLIKNKYKQTHQLFKQIEKIKMEKSTQREKGSRRKRGNIETSQGEKINAIKQNILSLKQQIQERNADYEKIKIQLAKLKEQKKNLLINLIKFGYYLSDGVKIFLEKLAQTGYQPNMNDFPQFLDLRSKQFLIKEYEDSVKFMKQQKALTQRSSFRSERTRAKSNAQLGILTKQQHFKDIYNGTKEYLSKLLLQQSWKNQSIKLPKIISSNPNELIEKRREIQKKRIKTAYPQQLREKVKKIQFGIKLQTILP